MLAAGSLAALVTTPTTTCPSPSATSKRYWRQLLGREGEGEEGEARQGACAQLSQTCSLRTAATQPQPPHHCTHSSSQARGSLLRLERLALQRDRAARGQRLAADVDHRRGAVLKAQACGSVRLGRGGWWSEAKGEQSASRHGTRQVAPGSSAAAAKQHGAPHPGRRRARAWPTAPCTRTRPPRCTRCTCAPREARPAGCRTAAARPGGPSCRGRAGARRAARCRRGCRLWGTKGGERGACMTCSHDLCPRRCSRVPDGRRASAAAAHRRRAHTGKRRRSPPRRRRGRPCAAAGSARGGWSCGWGVGGRGGRTGDERSVSRLGARHIPGSACPPTLRHSPLCGSSSYRPGGVLEVVPSRRSVGHRHAPGAARPHACQSTIRRGRPLRERPAAAGAEQRSTGASGELSRHRAAPHQTGLGRPAGPPPCG